MKQAGKTLITYVNTGLGKNFNFFFSCQILTCSAIFFIIYFLNNVKS